MEADTGQEAQAMKHDFEPTDQSGFYEQDPESRSASYGWWSLGDSSVRHKHSGVMGELDQMAIKAFEETERRWEKSFDEYFKLRREHRIKSYVSPDVYAKINEAKEAPAKPSMKRFTKAQRKRFRKKLAGTRGPFYIDK